MFLGCVGTTATGRSHKFWICGGRSPLEYKLATDGIGIYGLIVWAILCISVLVSEVRKGGSIRTDRFYNNSGWKSKPYVYLLGWQYSTIASGVVSHPFGSCAVLMYRMLLLSSSAHLDDFPG